MNKIEVFTLYSGSGGNSTYVSCGDCAILIDAGKSARALENALISAGKNIRDISAIFVTHEHADHIGALEIISKKHHIPVHMTSVSADSSVRCGSALCSVVKAHTPLFSEQIGDMKISSFVTPHDSAMCVGYRIECGDSSAAVATDIGVVTPEILSALEGCSRVVLESNHDKRLLEIGPYSYELKMRIKSEIGHLSNDDAAVGAKLLVKMGSEKIILGHLSGENNYPELAYETVKSYLSEFNIKVNKDVLLSVAKA